MSVIAYGPAMESGLYAERVRGAVLRALCNAADDEKWQCYPSYEFLAFVAGVGRSTAIREIRSLEYCGLIECVETGGGRRRSNLYYVNVTWIEYCRDRVRAAKVSAGPDGKHRVAAMKSARADCEKILAILERMTRRIDGAKTQQEAKAAAMQRALATAERMLKNGPAASVNRPAGGRFKIGNGPAGNLNRPAGDIETVPPGDPNRKITYQSEKTRARGDAAHSGATPPDAKAAGGEVAPGSSNAGAGGEGGGLSKTGQAESAAPSRRMTPRAVLLFNQRTVIVDWIACRNSFGAVLQNSGMRAGMMADEFEAAVLALDPVALKECRGFIGWAHRALHADPAVDSPIPPVVEIIRALSDGADKALAQLRCAKLLGRAFRVDDVPENFGKPRASKKESAADGDDSENSESEAA